MGSRRSEGEAGLDAHPDIETDLLDLRHVSLSQARRDTEAIERPTNNLLKQVEKPRTNLGSGPPGRAD